MQAVPVSLASALAPAADASPRKVSLLGWAGGQHADVHELGAAAAAHVVGAHRTLELPLGALCRGADQMPLQDAEQMSPAHMPTSPPPMLPPSVPLSLFEALPAAPPVLPPLLPAEMALFQTQMAAMDAVGRTSSPPASPPPSLPPALSMVPSSMPQSPPPALPASFGPLSDAAPANEAPPPTLPPSLPAEVLFGDRSPEDLVPTDLFARMASQESELADAAAKLMLPIRAFGRQAADLAWPADDLGGVQGDSAPDFVGGRPMAFPPGLSPPAGSPSHGSTLHGTGHCRPCAWFWKPSGCLNGLECTRCHLCPVGEIKARKKVKQTVMQLGLATPQHIVLQQSSPLDQPLGFSLVPEVMSTVEAAAHDFQAQAPPLPAGGAGQSRGRSFSSDQESTTGAGSSSEPEGTSSSEHGSAVVPGREAPAKGSPETSSKADLHSAGRCRPCAWYWKPVGCQSEKDCKYCHLCPEGELKSRKKSKAMMMRMGLATPQSDLAPEQQTKLALSLAPLL